MASGVSPSIRRKSCFDEATCSGWLHHKKGVIMQCCHAPARALAAPVGEMDSACQAGGCYSNPLCPLQSRSQRWGAKALQVAPAMWLEEQGW